MQHFTCISTLTVNRSLSLVIGGCQSCSCLSYCDDFRLCLKIKIDLIQIHTGVIERIFFSPINQNLRKESIWFLFQAQDGISIHQEVQLLSARSPKCLFYFSKTSFMNNIKITLIFPNMNGQNNHKIFFLKKTILLPVFPVIILTRPCTCCQLF